MRPLALLLPCFLALPACAQKAKPAPAKVEPAKEAKVDWDGEWTLHASQSDKIDEQIETHLKDLNFGLRLLWKKKLQSACRSHGQLDILAGGTFSVALDKERSIDTPFDGTEETWKRSDGETFKASLSGQGPTLVQTLAGESYVLKTLGRCAGSRRRPCPATLPGGRPPATCRPSWATTCPGNRPATHPCHCVSRCRTGISSRRATIPASSRS